MLGRLAFLAALVLAPTAATAQNFFDIEPDWLEKAERTISSNQVYGPKVTGRQIEPSTDEPYRIPLTLVLLEGSDWGDKDIIAQIRTAEKIYKPCDVSFGPIVLLEAKTTYDLQRLGRGVDQELTQEWANEYVPRDLELTRLDLPRPLVILRERGGGYSYNDSLILDPYYEPLRDTLFIPSDDFRMHGDSRTTAHELAHVLFNEDHNEIVGNLLACFGSDCSGNKISKSQCAAAQDWHARKAAADPWALVGR